MPQLVGSDLKRPSYYDDTQGKNPHKIAVNYGKMYLLKSSKLGNFFRLIKALKLGLEYELEG